MAGEQLTTVQGLGGFAYRVCRQCRYEQTHCRCEVMMTAEEHDHMQELEGLVKRYRSRIVALKEEPRIVPGEVFSAELLWQMADGGPQRIMVRVTDIRQEDDGIKVLVLEQTEWTGGNHTKPLEAEGVWYCGHCHQPTPVNAPQLYRCSGCGHRWHGPLGGATLCGECWRKGQEAVFGEPPQPRDGSDCNLGIGNIDRGAL